MSTKSPTNLKLNKALMLTLGIMFALYACMANNDQIQSTPVETKAAGLDGFRLEVNLIDNTCKDYSKPIDIMFTFVNDRDMVIRIPELFVVSKNKRGSGGNIVPNIYFEGEEIYTLHDKSMLDIPWPTSNSFVDIPPKGTLKRAVHFRFPSDILKSRVTKNEVIVTPSPGVYLLTFTYYQIETTFSSWQGFIDSAPVEICLIN